jgi:hypothetical protein
MFEILVYVKNLVMDEPLYSGSDKHMQSGIVQKYSKI